MAAESQSRLTAGLRDALKWNFPAGEHKDSRMTLEGPGKNLGALDTQVHATVLDGGDSGVLRDTGEPERRSREGNQPAQLVGGPARPAG
jgi:hypothetical protein